jgi:hypothetical protein
MFSYPKTNSSPIVIQGSFPQQSVLNEKPSFLNILNRAPEKEKSTLNTFNASVSSINIGKDDGISQRSNSTSKFDLNKFKITKGDSKSVENIISNKTKLEPNTNRQTLQSGNHSPNVQTIENNTSYNGLNGNAHNKAKSLNVTSENIAPRKNNLSKYLINEESIRDVRSSSTNRTNENAFNPKMTQVINSNLYINNNAQKQQLNNNISNENLHSHQQSEHNYNKNVQSSLSSPLKPQINSNIKAQNAYSHNNSHILEDTNINKSIYKTEEPSKPERNLILIQPYEFESRRLTLELIK